MTAAFVDKMFKGSGYSKKEKAEMVWFFQVVCVVEKHGVCFGNVWADSATMHCCREQVLAEILVMGTVGTS